MHDLRTYYEGSVIMLEGRPWPWSLVLGMCLVLGALLAVVLANVAIILRGV